MDDKKCARKDKRRDSELTINDALCALVGPLSRIKKELGSGDYIVSLCFGLKRSGMFQLMVGLSGDVPSWITEEMPAEDFANLEISEKNISDFLKSKIKTKIQSLEAQIEEQTGNFYRAKRDLIFLKNQLRKAKGEATNGID